MLNNFWQIWRNEYLLSLRERTQSRLKSNRIRSSVKPNVGDVVIVKDNIPRGNWKLAKIEQLVPSRDGEIRSCKIKRASGNILNRPMNLLYPIETSHEFDKPQINRTERIPIDVRQQSPLHVQIDRPVRASASKALEAIKQQLSN